MPVEVNATQGSLLGFLYDAPEDRMGPAPGDRPGPGALLERHPQPRLPRAPHAAGPQARHRRPHRGPRPSSLHHHRGGQEGFQALDRAGTRSRTDPQPAAHHLVVRTPPRRRHPGRDPRVEPRRPRQAAPLLREHHRHRSPHRRRRSPSASPTKRPSSLGSTSSPPHPGWERHLVWERRSRSPRGRRRPLLDVARGRVVDPVGGARESGA